MFLILLGLFNQSSITLSILAGTTASCADSALHARQQCLHFLHQRLKKMTRLDQEMLEALRVYDRSLARDPQWGQDFFGIDPFYIALGTKLRPLPGLFTSSMSCSLMSSSSLQVPRRGAATCRTMPWRRAPPLSTPSDSSGHSSCKGRCCWRAPQALAKLAWWRRWPRPPGTA